MHNLLARGSNIEIVLIKHLQGLSNERKIKELLFAGRQYNDRMLNLEEITDCSWESHKQ